MTAFTFYNLISSHWIHVQPLGFLSNHPTGLVASLTCIPASGLTLQSTLHQPCQMSLSRAWLQSYPPSSECSLTPCHLCGMNFQDWGSRLLTMWFQWFQRRQPAVPHSHLLYSNSSECISGSITMPALFCLHVFARATPSTWNVLLTLPPIGEILHDPDQVSCPCDASSSHPAEVIATSCQLPW